MDVNIETERLILRKLVAEDVDRLFLLDSNPEVMKYIGMPTLSKVDESKEVVKMIMQQYAENGVGRLAVIEKESGLLIGWSGIKLNTSVVNNHQNFYELGYRFLPETWGKGYATESGRASLEYCFNDLKAEKIYAYARSDNQASNQVLTKLGFKKTSEFTEPDGVCFWYEFKKENFKK